MDQRRLLGAAPVTGRAGAAVFRLFLLACIVLQGCASSDADIDIERLADGVWLHTSYYTYPSGTRLPSNGLVVRSQDELTLVDTAWGELLTIGLVTKIEREIGLPVTQAIVTHAHADRIAGVDALESRGIKVYSHPDTQRLAARQGLPVPDLILPALATPGSSSALGELEAHYPGPAHAPDNLVIWLPGHGILFGGCAVRPAKADSLGNIADADLTNWQAVMQYLLGQFSDARLVIPGHGAPGDIGLLQHTARLAEPEE